MKRLFIAACFLGSLGFDFESPAAQIAASDTLTIDTRFINIANSAIFTLETRPWDGASDSSNSGLFTLEVLGSSVLSLTISGPQQVPPNSRTPYIARALFSDGTLADVTARCQWQYSALPVGASFASGVLVTDGSTQGGAFQITASYAGTGGGRISPAFSVAVSSSSWCKMSPVVVDPLAGSDPPAWFVGASVTTAPHLVQPLTYAWNISTSVVGGNASWISLSNFSGVLPGTYTVSVTVTDGNGSIAADGKLVTFNKPSVPLEPVTTGDTRDLVAASFKDRFGDPFTFDQNRVANGFVVITHGLNDNTEGWAQTMAREIEERMGGPEHAPNILLFDWREAADVNKLNSEKLVAYADEIKWRNPIFAAELVAAGALDGAAEVLMIQGNGFSQGQDLAAALLPQFTDAQPPLISTAAPIHFIGHSAGGFVVGEAAKGLFDRAKKDSAHFPSGFRVGMVTMLDTPDPYVTHFEPQVATVVERYVSSLLGAYAPDLEHSQSQTTGPLLGLGIYDVKPSASYRREFVPDWKPNTLEGHSEAHEWYIRTIENTDESGFNHSPILAASQAAGGNLMSIARIAAYTSEAADAAPPPQPVATGGFTPFGNATITATGFDIVESSNAGVFQNMTVPVGADVLHFEFRFTTPGDGDFLSVQFADRLPLFIGSDTEMSRANWVDVDIPIRELQTKTGDLMFALISRGSANATVSIRNLTLSTHPDVDFDGLTNDQEATVGTNPLAYDSDGETLSDAEEINTYFTNPMLADSDGDGASDSAELTAGTSPTNGQSFLRVTDMTKNTGGTFTLRWPSQAGRFYNVQRSADVTFATYDVIGQGIAAALPQNTFVDTSAGSAPGGRFFYRIEVYAP